MTTSATALETLRRQRPEWAPWLAVLQAVLQDLNEATWEEAVPASVRADATAPLLRGIELAVQATSVQRLLQRLIRTATRAGTLKLASLQSALAADHDVLRLFEAPLCRNREYIQGIAAPSAADADAFEAVIGLVALPFLQACNRRWASSVSDAWVKTYCPICGSWPAFVEVLGIERRRSFRCGRCGSGWHAHMLQCPYCATSNHDELITLRPESGGAQALIEACLRCHGYLKAFMRLQGCPAGTVMIEDLASVDLDVAALDFGYTRPQDAGYALDTVTDRGAPRRFFAWKA